MNENNNKDNYVENLKGFMEAMEKHPNIELYESWGDIGELKEYNRKALIFNRRLLMKPFVIAYCKCEEDVVNVFSASIANFLPIRVRAGGHDHEGECTGTGTILIDVSKMDSVEPDEDTGIVKVGPGNRFSRLTSKLADHDLMIAHGTCATVGISGYTMGGGWGPWTRKYGMGCERLIGARVLLGDGVVYDTEKDDLPDLLWALKGGGGMSYGIVTEFRFQAFELPCELHRFELEWNEYIPGDPYDGVESKVSTFRILEKWEDVILSEKTPNLTGTNLKINATTWLEGREIPGDTIYHNCTMYGYWEGGEETLNTFIENHFGKPYAPGRVKIEPAVGSCFKHKKYGENLMSSWDRESHQKVKLRMGLLEGTPFQPDEDQPAPHKITSRLVNKKGLNADNKEGRRELLETLCSHLVIPGNRALGLFTYVTLGAIRGDFYRENPDTDNKRNAFPYSESQYTIQYQCWWNETEAEKGEGQDNDVYNRINRGMDWIETSRDAKISNTSGAFISFKDSSIPTETYFGESYDRLKKVKKDISKDPQNHFRTRKTII